MNKKFLEVPQLFQKVKEFEYTYDIPLFHAVGTDMDLKEHVLDVFRNKMVKDLITTLEESNEILVPVLTEITQTEDKGRMCFCLHQKLQFYKFIINISEDVFNVTEPASTFSIRGMVGKRPDKVVMHEPDMDLERPQHWRKY